jgi:hypothetical protein
VHKRRPSLLPSDLYPERPRGPTGSGRAPFLKRWSHVMRTALCFAMLLIPTVAFGQGATPAKRPTVGAKPLVQAKPRGARWLQARRNGQGNEALGGRMHGGARGKNRYASRGGVESDVGPRRGGRGYSEGSAVTLQLCAISIRSSRTKKLPVRGSRKSANFAPKTSSRSTAFGVLSLGLRGVRDVGCG